MHGTMLVVDLLLTPVTILAGTVAPAKPSQIVVLAGTGAGTPCGSGETPIDQLVNGDGSASTLVIPKGQVFVLTGGEWSAETPAGSVCPNHILSNTMYRYVLAPAGGAHALFSVTAMTSDEANHVAGTFTVPTGLVVRPGTTLCSSVVGPLSPNGACTTTSFPASISAHGFFTRDR